MNKLEGHINLKQKSKLPKLTEHQLQTQVINYLRVRHIYCFSVPNGFYAGKGGNVQGYIRKMKASGLTPGVADVVVLLNGGKTVFLELKVGSNKQEISQVQFEKDVKELGFEYYVVKSLDDVIKIFGIKK